jgi:hypothetical protein
MLAALAKLLVSKEVIMILQANQRKDTAMDQDYPEDYDPTDYEGEQYAEFVMSWVSGGGSASDADAAWDSGIAHNAGYTSAPEGEGDEPRPYYMEMTPEEREADHLRFEMAMDFDGF